jgi:hypothetical protein
VNRTTYEQRTLAVLKAVAVSQGTIHSGDLAWAINYQRVTRPLNDMLLTLRPILEDNKWPPLTCLVIQSNRQPVLEADQVADFRMQQRRCHVWAMEQATQRRKLRDQWADLVLGGDDSGVSGA